MANDGNIRNALADGKPNLSKFTMVGSLFVQRYERYLPTAFDESMTLLEKMNKIIEYMNEIGKLVTGAFEQWNEVLEWVMNEGLNQAVVDKLTEMIDDGTLENLINKELLGNKASITVSVASPFSPDETSFWFEDLGDTTNRMFGASVIVDEERVIYDE